MTGFDKLQYPRLPDKEEFHSKLNNMDISDEDYAHAQKVWNAFRCKKMGDYHDLYMKTDMLLLTDVMENFGDMYTSVHKLDPLHYYTAPLAWDAALKKTKVQLELIPCFLEVDMEYPKELHDLHNNMPVAPEHVMVRKVKKLIPGLNDRAKYIIHHRALKQCISLGLKVMKIHCGVKFKVRPWLIIQGRE